MQEIEEEVKVDLSGDFDFTTAGSEWILFKYRAHWNDTSNAMTFFLLPDATLPADKTVTFVTNLDEFVLPVEVPADNPEFLYDQILNSKQSLGRNLNYLFYFLALKKDLFQVKKITKKCKSHLV